MSSVSSLAAVQGAFEAVARSTHISAASHDDGNGDDFCSLTGTVRKDTGDSPDSEDHLGTKLLQTCKVAKDKDTPVTKKSKKGG